MKPCVVLALTLLTATAGAQSPAPTDSAATFTMYGFLDGYYGYDFTGKAPQRPAFLYAHHRANEFAVNHALLGLRYQDARTRAALGLHAGTYVEANYAAEPPVLRHVYEAYAGFRPWAKAWLDLGIFGSHIGFESAASQDNWTLSRSLMAENSPYYEAGARLTVEAGARLTLTALVLNGWQNLRDNNRAKAVGTQLQWKPTARLLLNSSTFLGNEQPRDSAGRRRWFHDFYLSYAATSRLSLAGVFDIGRQAAGGRRADTWHTGAALARYRLASRWTAAARYEYYFAERGVVVRTPTPAAADADFRVHGGSLNLDYAPAPRLLCRLEGRLLRGCMFTDRNQQPTTTYGNLTSSMAFSF